MLCQSSVDLESQKDAYTTFKQADVKAKGSIEKVKSILTKSSPAVSKAIKRKLVFRDEYPESPSKESRTEKRATPDRIVVYEIEDEEVIPVPQIPAKSF